VALYKLTRAAEVDLETIARFTLIEWNEKQARKYLQEIFDCMNSLARMPGQGAPWPARGSKYNRFRQGKHWVYYKIDSPGIMVIRVLHQSMNQPRKILAFDIGKL
jgi:toxin ParE1/3/4